MKEFANNNISIDEYVSRLSSVIIFDAVPLTQISELRGTYGFDPLIEPQEDFSNVAKHTVKAMLVTDVLGEWLHLDLATRKNLNLAGFIHDSNKKTERMWQISIESAERDKTALIEDEGNIEGKRKQTALLNTETMEEWENAEWGCDPQVYALMRANVPPSEQGHGDDIAAKILWFADACLSGDKIVPIGQRFDQLENDPRNGERNKQFSDTFKTKYNGKPLYDVQRELGMNYEREFAEKLGIEPKQLYDWIQTKVDEKIQTFQIPTLP